MRTSAWFKVPLPLIEEAGICCLFSFFLLISSLSKLCTFNYCRVWKHSLPPLSLEPLDPTGLLVSMISLKYNFFLYLKITSLYYWLFQFFPWFYIYHSVYLRLIFLTNVYNMLWSHSLTITFLYPQFFWTSLFPSSSLLLSCGFVVCFVFAELLSITRVVSMNMNDVKLFIETWAIY